MAGYTRTGVGVEDNIADGLTINAADFNAEYNAIEVAFGTSGHTHDGTAGNGPAITAVQPAAIRAGTLSPAGEPLHKFPPKEALP